jgi:glycosyltransferase involved in cell wall biosynthesis
MNSSSMPAPRFSILMNVYNGERYLRAAIESVLAQTFQDWELTIWDDRSTDRSAAICASYVDPRLRLIVSEVNIGLGAGRNAALPLTNGEWIAFLDQDDIWTPDKLAAQHELIASDQSGRLALVYGRTERFDDRGPIGPFDPWYGTRRLPEGDILDALLARPSFISDSSLAVKRSPLMALLPLPAHINFCIDYYLCMMISRQYEVACVQTLCCHYRVHPGSMTSVFRREAHVEILDIIRTATRPSQRRMMMLRRRVHESFIGLEDFRSGRWKEGFGRIVLRGSPTYLALRPLVLAARRLRDRARQS